MDGLTAFYHDERLLDDLEHPDVRFEVIRREFTERRQWLAACHVPCNTGPGERLCTSVDCTRGFPAQDR